MNQNYLQMNSFLLKNTAILIIILNSFNISAQQDSIKVTNTEESIDSSNYRYKLKYRYLDINMKNETNLYKAGYFVNAFANTQGMQLSFEHKLKPSLSILSKAAYFGYFGANQTDSTTTSDTYISLIMEGRWYYGINKKIKTGISGNNFNSNYLCFGLGPVFPLEERPGAIATTGWGIQRRLNSFSYIDISFRLDFGMNSKVIDFTETINLEIGFGGSRKKKR